jgi:hypothetical protein
MIRTVHISAGFGVLTAVVMKSSIFWDGRMCSPLKACYLLLSGFLLGLFFDLEDVGVIFFRNVG